MSLAKLDYLKVLNNLTDRLSIYLHLFRINWRKMWDFKKKQILIFIAIFLVLYAILLLISTLILFTYEDLTTGEQLYSKIVGVVIYFPLNPLWNHSEWAFLMLLLNGSFWGFICYSIIFGIKKFKGKA